MWEPPEAWDLAPAQLQLQRDIGKSKPLLSPEVLAFLLKAHKTLLMLSGELEKGANSNERTVFFSALVDVRLLLVAMESRVTHDLFQRAWCEEDTRKKRDTSQALADMDKIGPHFKSVLRKDMVKTASFISTSFGLQGRGSSQSHGRQRGNQSSGAAGKQKFMPRKFNKAAQQQFETNASTASAAAGASSGNAAGWNPNYKGRPDNFIPGFVRKDAKQEKKP